MRALCQGLLPRAWQCLGRRRQHPSTWPPEYSESAVAAQAPAPYARYKARPLLIPDAVAHARSPMRAQPYGVTITLAYPLVASALLPSPLPINIPAYAHLRLCTPTRSSPTLSQPNLTCASALQGLGQSRAIRLPLLSTRHVQEPAGSGRSGYWSTRVALTAGGVGHAAG